MRALANFWVCRSWQGNGLRTGSFLARRCGTVGKKFVEYVEASAIRARLPVPAPLSGKKATDQLHQSAQNPHRTGCRRHVAGTQHGSAQILFRLVIEADETH